MVKLLGLEKKAERNKLQTYVSKLFNPPQSPRTGPWADYENQPLQAEVQSTPAQPGESIS